MKKKLVIGALATAALCCSVAVSGCSIFGGGNNGNHNHTLQHHDGQAATCTEDGWKEYDTCSECDYSTYTVIPASGHSYEDYVCNCGYVDPEAPDTTEGLKFEAGNYGDWTVKRVSVEAVGRFVKIPATYEGKAVTAIADFGFAGCSSLVSIIIPDSVTKIGSNAFKSCTALKSVTFENTERWRAGSTNLSSNDLADTATAATFLTATYLERDWWIY